MVLTASQPFRFCFAWSPSALLHQVVKHAVSVLCRLVEGESLMDYMDMLTANTSAKQWVDIVAATLRKVLLGQL